MPGSNKAVYGLSSDMFSTAATLFYLATGLVPLDERADEDVANRYRIGDRPDAFETGCKRL